MPLFTVGLTDEQIAAVDEKSTTLFRLVGEPEGKWHVLARPFDYCARQYLDDYYGREVECAANDPQWRSKRSIAKYRERYTDMFFVGGPLDGCRQPTDNEPFDYRSYIQMGSEIVVVCYRRTVAGAPAKFVGFEQREVKGVPQVV